MNDKDNIHTKKENFKQLPAVMEKTSLKKTLIYKLMKLGQFPANVRISAKRVAWLESEIDAWMLSKLNNKKA